MTFPVSPATGDVWTALSGTTYQYTGDAWKVTNIYSSGGVILPDNASGVSTSAILTLGAHPGAWEVVIGAWDDTPNGLRADFSGDGGSTWTVLDNSMGFLNAKLSVICQKIYGGSSTYTERIVVSGLTASDTNDTYDVVSTSTVTIGALVKFRIRTLTTGKVSYYKFAAKTLF